MPSAWIERQGSKPSGFRYVTASGKPVRDPRTLARIDALRIPPAWRDVHIAPGAGAMLQAWGLDAKGRKQYRYHDRAARIRDARKYYRVRQLARDLPHIREALYRSVAARPPSRDHVSAVVVSLISKGFFRIGSERYLKENNTFGLVTLRKKHVHVQGDCIYFDYRGKGSIAQHHCVVDAKLARAVRELLDAPGARVFRYRDDEGWHDLTAREVNEYLRTVTGRHYTAKDFRTWGGTVRLATVLAELGPAEQERERKKNVNMALRMVAAELGNTPAICRASYVHPIVLARYVDEGETIGNARAPSAARGARQRGGPYPEERALIAFLDRWFPERRRRVRPEELAAA